MADKSNQDIFKKNIISCLILEQYPHITSVKELDNPNKAKFLDIYYFLVERLVGERIEHENYLVELPEFLKTLGYPNKIPNSAIKSIGTMTTWYALLYPLNWMAELINYNREMEAEVDY